MFLNAPAFAESDPIIMTLSSTPPRVEGMAVDSNSNVYIVVNNYVYGLHLTGGGIIYKIDPNGHFSLFAGNGMPNGGIRYIHNAAVDSSGYLYVSEKSCERVVKVVASNAVTPIAGQASPDYGFFDIGFSGDGGPATSALLYCPAGIAVHSSGNVYIADQHNHRIRKVDTNGIISTFAGGGLDSNGDGGLATNAKLSEPASVAVDSPGNIYIIEANAQRVRKVDINGIISTFAGNGSAGYSGDGGPATNAQLSAPAAIVADSRGNVYIADCGNSVIRKVDINGIISTFAGNGSAGYSGDGGPATNAQLSCPNFIGVDDMDDVYMVDRDNDVIRKIVINHAPVALDDIDITTADAPITIKVLDNDSDVNSGDTLSVIAVSTPISGSVGISGTSQILYTPTLTFVGTDVFIYTIADTSGLTATAKVSITVMAANEPPTAINDAVGSFQGQAVTIAVLANDLDVAGGGLTVASVVQPSHGLVTITNSEQMVIYTPTHEFQGIDSFTYVARDSNGKTDTALAAIVVSAQDNATAAPQIGIVTPVTDTQLSFTGNQVKLDIALPTGVYTGLVGTKDIFYLAYTLEISAANTNQIEEDLSDFQFGDVVFDLSAYLNNSRLNDLHFANPVTLTITYEPTLLDVLPPQRLTLLYWNGTTWTNDGITMFMHDEVDHYIVATVAHLSQFALFVNAPTSILPEEEYIQRLFLPFIHQ